VALGEATRHRAGQGRQCQVADEGERAIMAKCVELRAAGCTLDKIRQHLNYEMKARTRLAGIGPPAGSPSWFSRDSDSWLKP